MKIKYLPLLVLPLLILAFALTFYIPSLGRFGSGPDPVQDALIKSQVQTAVSMLQGVYDLQQSGQLSAQQAETMAAALLRGLGYGQDGYFWADNTQGVNIVLYGRPDVEGSNRLQAQDVKGTFYVQEFLKTGLAGGGFVEYWFPKKGESTAQPKRSYVMLFEPFGWVVGTGYYR